MKILSKVNDFFKKIQLTKLDFAMLIGLIMAISLTSFSSFARYCELKENEVLRLHILANSDSDEDQQLKYAVRDKLLGEFANDMKIAQNVDQAKNIARNNVEKYEQISQKFVNEQGYDYNIHAEVVNMYFTTRNYEKYTLPAGNYDAVRILIGSGDGKNWWCLMYPSLCLPAVSEIDEVDKTDENSETEQIVLTNETSEKIEKSDEIEFKFAIYEFFKGFFSKD